MKKVEKKAEPKYAGIPVHKAIKELLKEITLWKNCTYTTLFISFLEEKGFNIPDTKGLVVIQPFNVTEEEIERIENNIRKKKSGSRQ